MIVDIVFLANTSDENMRQMTQNAIDSFLASHDPAKCGVVVVETNPNTGKYPGAVTLIPGEPFNYNRFLNIGFRHLLNQQEQSDYTVIANNDVVFHKNWLKNIVKEMKYNNLDAASPKNPGWFQHTDVKDYTLKGWGIGKHFCGWCIIIKTESLKKLLPFDEQFEFWCQDNDMAMRMQELGMKHAVVGKSEVVHLTNKSHHLVQDLRHATDGMVERYHAKWG